MNHDIKINIDHARRLVDKINNGSTSGSEKAMLIDHARLLIELSQTLIAAERHEVEMTIPTVVVEPVEEVPVRKVHEAAEIEWAVAAAKINNTDRELLLFDSQQQAQTWLDRYGKAHDVLVCRVNTPWTKVR